MNKKDYQKPAMRVVLLQHQQHLLAGSYGVNSVDSNLDDSQKRRDRKPFLNKIATKQQETNRKCK